MGRRNTERVIWDLSKATVGRKMSYVTRETDLRKKTGGTTDFIKTQHMAEGG